MTKKEKLANLENQINHNIRRLQEANEQCVIHVREHEWHSWNDAVTEAAQQLRGALKERSRLIEELGLANKTKMKKCCKICVHCKNNVCEVSMFHWLQRPPHIMFPESYSCKKFIFDEERAKERDIILDESDEPS